MAQKTLRNTKLKVIFGCLSFAMALIFVKSPLFPILKYRVAPDFPENKAQTLRLRNLKEKVSVYFDDFGIPHIDAQNLEDLVRATGFVQARYRGFQLDLMRKFAAGRLSELLGNQKALNSSTVEFDLAMRGWGFEKRTKIDPSKLPQEDRLILEAFSDGVNQGMARYPSIEHRILGSSPAPWTYQDTLLVGLLQAWSITHNWEQEAIKFSMAMEAGPGIAQKIYPLDPVYDYGTLKTETSTGLPPKAAPEALKFLEEIAKKRLAKKDLQASFGDLAQLRPSASNAWVVGEGLSASGAPILHNDMHLTHSLPSLIFLQHLSMPGMNAAGASMPGLPFLISGYNGHVAWGVTSASADVVDLVIEREDPQNPGYALNESRSCPIREEEVVIKVKGEEPRSFSSRFTCNGTLLNDMYPRLFPEGAPMLAIRYRLPKVHESFGNLLRANKARDVYELRDALMNIPAPIQNVMAADRQGNIGFFSTGSVPKRKHHRGVFPVPGWISKYEWQGWMSPSEMPHGFNPSQGFYVNANNLVHNPLKNSPVFHIDAAPRHRFDRITERINALKTKDQASLLEIQRDNFLERAKKLAPSLISRIETIVSRDKDEQRKKMLEELKSWDYQASEDSAGGAIFMSLYRWLIKGALEQRFSPGLVHAFFKQRYSVSVADTWMRVEDHTVWDDPSTSKKETLSDSLDEAMKSAYAELKQKMGENPSAWKWGQLHYHRPTHPFGKKSVLDFFNLQTIPLAGGLDSVWKAHFELQDEKNPYRVVAGPVYRFSIDLGNPEKALYSSDTGASGWPLSPHYSDQYEKWRKGELVSIQRNFEKVRLENKERKMELVP